jgi:hypothetical protein
MKQEHTDTLRAMINTLPEAESEALRALIIEANLGLAFRQQYIGERTRVYPGFSYEVARAKAQADADTFETAFRKAAGQTE